MSTLECGIAALLIRTGLVTYPDQQKQYLRVWYLSFKLFYTFQFHFLGILRPWCCEGQSSLVKVKRLQVEELKSLCPFNCQICDWGPLGNSSPRGAIRRQQPHELFLVRPGKEPPRLYMPRIMRNNKILLFYTTKFCNVLLHSNRYKNNAYLLGL